MSHHDPRPASLHPSPKYSSPDNSAPYTLRPHPWQKLSASDADRLETAHDSWLGWQRKSDPAYF